MKVKTIGFKNGGRPVFVELDEGATIANLKSSLGITVPCAFIVNSKPQEDCFALSEGDNVSYVATNIKGA